MVATGHGSRADRWFGEVDRERSLRLIDVVVLVMVSVVAVGIHMEAFPQLSPFDEATHVDYVVSLGALELPELGRPYDEVVLREWSCRGNYHPPTVLPPCDAESLDHTAYPAQGVQRNKTPPLYYAITALLSRPVAALSDASDVGLARLVGALYLSIGLAGLVQSARQLGASRWPTLMVAASVPFSVPAVLHATSTVNSDALVFAFGGAAVAVAITMTRTAVSLRWILILAIIAGLSKQTAVLPVIAVSVIILGAILGPVPRAKLSGKRSVAVAAAAAAPLIALVTVLVWWEIVQLWTPEGFVSPIGNGNALEVVGNPIDEFLRTSLDLVPPTGLNLVPVQIQSPWHEPWSDLIGVLILAAVGANLRSKELAHRIAALALPVAGVLGSLLIQAGSFQARGTAFPEVSTRYALGLVPLGFCLVCVATGHRWLSWVVAFALVLGGVFVSATAMG